MDEKDENLVEYDGIWLNVRANLVSSDIYQLIADGWYERQEATLVQRHLPPDSDVIELGAGIGYVSCVIDEVLDEGRTHLAIEPHPKAVQSLAEARESNNATYTICETAYSATSDVVELQPQRDFWKTSTRNGHGAAEAFDVAEVPTSTLRQLCDRYGLSKFSLVMDIEGAEYELLLSELDLLEERCPFLLVEFHDEGQYASSYTDELRDSNFELIDGLETVAAYRNTALGSTIRG